MLGPLLVLCVALVLAFLVFHTVEHGVEGLFLSCALALVVATRLAVVTGRISRISPELASRARRGPPRPIQGSQVPLGRCAAVVALPLRR